MATTQKVKAGRARAATGKKSVAATKPARPGSAVRTAAGNPAVAAKGAKAVAKGGAKAVAKGGAKAVAKGGAKGAAASKRVKGIEPADGTRGSNGAARAAGASRARKPAEAAAPGAGRERSRAATTPADPRAATRGQVMRATPESVRAAAAAGEAAPAPSRGADARGKYVYCIIEANEPLRFGPIGIGSDPAEVHTVNYQDIAAVVSDTPIEVHDPTRENVLAHERVNETVMRKHTVIPMSFGTVFKTREDIIELLRSAYDAFHDVLVKMQDKLEFGLKVLWDRDVMLAEIENDDEDVRRLKREISTQKGSTYFARMQYGRLVDASLQARSERYVADIFAQLRDVAVASRANKPIGDKMIMNAAFLVSRDKEAAFDAKVKEIGAKYDKLTFKYTGPWPPYNFVNVRLKLERAKDVE